jgi:hypothetical protein
MMLRRIAAFFLILSLPMQTASASMADIMPEDSAVYFDLDLNNLPQNDLVTALKSLADEFSSSLPGDASANLIREIVTNGTFGLGVSPPSDDAEAVTYATFTITEKQFADYIASEKKLEKKMYEKHEYYLKNESAFAKIGELLLLVSSEDQMVSLFKKIDAGQTLFKSSKFSSTLGGLESKRFLGYFVDFGEVLKSVSGMLSGGDEVSEALNSLKYLGASIHTFDGGLSFDTLNVRNPSSSGASHVSSPFTPTMYKYATSKKPLLYLEGSDMAASAQREWNLFSGAGLLDEKEIWVRDFFKLVSKGYSFSVETSGNSLIPSLTFMADVSANEDKAVSFLKNMYEVLLEETEGQDVKIFLDADQKALTFQINMPKEFDNDVADLLDENYIFEVRFRVTPDHVLVVSTNPSWEQQYATGVDMAEFGDLMKRSDVIGLFSMNLENIKDIAKRFVQQYYDGLSQEFRPYFRLSDALSSIEQILSPWKRLSGSWMTSGLTDRGSLKLSVDPKVYKQAYWQEVIASGKKLDEVFGQYDQVSRRFNDVERDEWFYSDVRKLKAKGIVKGYEDDTFRPGQNVSRIEFLVMLYRGVYGNPPAVNWIGEEKGLAFDDVEAHAWYYPILDDAFNKGLVKGYNGTSFRPGAPITRAEAVAMLHRFYEFNNEAEFFVNLESRAEEKKFSDVSRNAWFYDSVNEAYRLGVVDGTAAGNFEPGRNLNRAESAKLINKFLRNKGAEVYSPHAD